MILKYIIDLIPFISSLQVTIANLSSKVDSLKIEVTSLRRSVAAPDTAAGNINMAMFTRLDMDHNTRQLQAAVADERLSHTDRDSVTESMKKYVSIPEQRLVQIGRRCLERDMARNLLGAVGREWGRRERGERLSEEIRSLDKRRQRRFEERMSQLGEDRRELAESLHHQLSDVEKLTGVFLIKPIYRSPEKESVIHTGLITPLPRPLPHPPHAHSTPPSRPRTVGVRVRERKGRGGAGGGGRGRGEDSGSHPDMKLVGRMAHSRLERRREEMGWTGE